MKITLLAAATALTLSAVPAFAQGNNEPFPNPVPGTTTAAHMQSADVGSEAYPDAAGRPGSRLNLLADALLPGAGSEAVVQTANSAPRGFEAGTAATAYAQSVERHLAAQAMRADAAYATAAFQARARN